jgi:hypothetical protein
MRDQGTRRRPPSTGRAPKPPGTVELGRSGRREHTGVFTARLEVHRSGLGQTTFSDGTVRGMARQAVVPGETAGDCARPADFLRGLADHLFFETAQPLQDAQSLRDDVTSSRPHSAEPGGIAGLVFHSTARRRDQPPLPPLGQKQVETDRGSGYTWPRGNPCPALPFSTSPSCLPIPGAAQRQTLGAARRESPRAMRRGTCLVGLSSVPENYGPAPCCGPFSD